jgi:hypothetical protein
MIFHDETVRFVHGGGPISERITLRSRRERSGDEISTVKKQQRSKRASPVLLLIFF